MTMHGLEGSFDMNAYRREMLADQRPASLMAAGEQDRQVTRTESLFDSIQGNTHRIYTINNRLSAVLERLIAASENESKTGDAASQPGTLGGIANQMREQSDALERLESIVSTLETI